MLRTALTWDWICSALSLRSGVAMSSGTILVVVVGLLALVFLAAGVLAFSRVQWLQRQEIKSAAKPLSGKARRSPQRYLSLVPFLALIIPLALFLVTWGSSAFPGGPFPPSLNSTTLAGASPSPAQVHGTLNVGTSITFPKQVYIDQKTNELAGFDIDLINALAQQLHLKLNLVQMDFGKLTDSLSSKQVDAVIAAYADTRVASFLTVPYLDPHEVVLTLKDTSATSNKITQFTVLTDLCGHTIGVLQFSNEDADLQKTKSRCAQKSPLKIVEEQNVDAVGNALASGQVEATYQDSPSSLYYEGQYPGKLQEIGSLQGSQEVILLRADDVSLYHSIQTAFQQLVQDGAYRQLLDEWHLGNDAIPSSNSTAVTGRASELNVPV